MKTEKQQRIAAAAFAKRWGGRGYEKGESQTFWIELLTEIFGVESPSVFITFEQQAQLDHTSFIDGMIPSIPSSRRSDTVPHCLIRSALDG